MYNVLLVAQHIIKYCNQKNLFVSNLKLQKLLYFVQAAFLVEKGQPCFPEEIEAWDFGPVVPIVYHKYKIYGSSNIPYIKVKGSLLGIISTHDIEIIDEIINECAKYTASMLVDITHRQTPWINAYEPYQSNVISKKSIKVFFRKR